MIFVFMKNSPTQVDLSFRVNANHLSGYVKIKKLLQLNLPTALIFFLIFQAFSISGFGQKKDITYANLQWLQYYNTVKINEKWTWSSDGGLRFSDTFQHFIQYNFRTQIGYLLTPKIRVDQGFAQSGSFKDGMLEAMEYRPFQQVLLREKIGKVKVSHRFRMEERIFRTAADGDNSAETEFYFRFRYALSLTIPIVSLSSAKPEKKLLLSIGDEIFLRAGKSIVYNVFGQNRLVVGPVFQLNNNMDIAILYNYLFAATDAPAEYVKSNILWITFKQKLELKKKEKDK